MHQRKPLPVQIALLIIALFILDAVANYFYLFWTFPWFDNPIHFLGGLSIAAAALWLYFSSGRMGTHAYSAREALRIALGSVLVIGAGFEIYEFIVNVIITHYLDCNVDYILDTSLDLLMDVIGASSAWVLFEYERRGKI